jgi:hypothetical protein
LAVALSGFVEFLTVFIHVSAWQNRHSSFTVTAVSGYATTYARQKGADDLTCDEAAGLLGVPPAALERWARQLSFPHDAGSGVEARFKRPAIEALRDALVSTHSVEGAVRAARDRTQT